jgi:hypothetical protein
VKVLFAPNPVQRYGKADNFLSRNQLKADSGELKASSSERQGFLRAIGALQRCGSEKVRQ